MKIKKLLAVSICFLLIATFACSETHRILSYESDYIPAVNAVFGISMDELCESKVSAIGSLSKMRAGSEDVFIYDTLEGSKTDSKFGGELNERYCFKDDKLVCMDAHITLKATKKYYRNADTIEELKAKTVENSQAIFTLIKNETGIVFDRDVDEINYDDFVATGSDGVRIVAFVMTPLMSTFNEDETIAGMGGSFSYCSIAVYVQPEGVKTGFEDAYEGR